MSCQILHYSISYNFFENKLELRHNHVLENIWSLLTTSNINISDENSKIDDIKGS